jgi:hypothetical protein
VFAQALLSQPALRGQSALELARTLHGSVPDARAAIGSILGMINRTALGNPDSALENEPSLALAVGPEMSLDRAMSRFGSHMGPIVNKPTPSPLWSPDVGPDRQYGAGRVHGHADRNYGAGRILVEAGDVAADIVAAAQQTIDFIDQNGCGPSPAGIVANFQALFNRDYSPKISVDDRYGQQTQGAVDQVVADANAQTPGSMPKTAPAACTYAAPVAPSPSPSPQPSPSLPVAPLLGVQHASMLSSGWTWAGLLVLAGAVVISKSKHPPKWARQIGLHR